MFKFALFFALCLLSINAVNAQTCAAAPDAKCLYASPDGDGVGSFAEPGSLQTLLVQLAKGDYLYLRGGEYSDYYVVKDYEMIINLEKSFSFSAPAPTAQEPITIKGYPGETAIIKGDFRSEGDVTGCIMIDKSSHIVFEDLIIRDCYNEGIFIGYDVPGEGITLRNIEITNIRYNDNSGFVTINGYKDTVIEDSRFHDYTIDSPQFGYYLKYFQAKNVTVRRNEFYGAGGGLYYKHGEATPSAGLATRIYDNHFYDLEREAVYTNQNRTEIYNNLIVGSDIAVHQEDGTRPPFTTNTEIAYNTIVNGGIILNSGSNDGSYFDGFGLGAKRANVHHNILLNSDYEIWRYGTDVQYNEGISLRSSDNCFFSETGGQAINFFGAEEPYGPLGQVYDLSGWQSFGYDRGSLEAAPMFNEDYSLDDASPCIGKGHTAIRAVSDPDQSVCLPIKTASKNLATICL